MMTRIDVMSMVVETVPDRGELDDKQMRDGNFNSVFISRVRNPGDFRTDEAFANTDGNLRCFEQLVTRIRTPLPGTIGSYGEKK